jgi:hypothetical protein
MGGVCVCFIDLLEHGPSKHFRTMRAEMAPDFALNAERWSIEAVNCGVGWREATHFAGREMWKFRFFLLCLYNGKQSVSIIYGHPPVKN